MNPILVEVFRGETRESFHRGVVCVVDKQGNTIAGLGDISQICYPRSTMKLFQHIPLLMSGAVQEYHLSEEEIAIMCGSHNGEERHRKLANDILVKAGLNANSLQCGAQMPELMSDKIALYKQGVKPQALHNNCSGKHSGFLLYCKYKGYDLNSYLDPNHPLQQEIKQVCADIYEYREEDMQIGVDGCSAPVYSFPVYNQALAYKNLVSQNTNLTKYQEALELTIRACSNHPYMLGGGKRYCSELMQIAGDKVIGKTGADGVYCLGIRDKEWGIAVKIDDGKMGPQYTVIQTLLAQLGILSKSECEQLQRFEKTENFNFSDRSTGFTVPSRLLSEFKLSE